MSLQLLTKEFKQLKSNPHEGFNVELVNDNIHLWEVGIFGVPDTSYEGGYFRALLKFSDNYPFSPFEMSFTSEMWHPNIYPNGDVCISILHPPGEDPLNSLERPEERWSPAQNVPNVIVSVISMLNDPEIRSPANVDASIMYQYNKEEYESIIRNLTKKSRQIALKDNIEIPMTIKEYTARTIEATTQKITNDFCSSSDYYFSEDSSDDFNFYY